MIWHICSGFINVLATIKTAYKSDWQLWHFIVGSASSSCVASLLTLKFNGCSSTFDCVKHVNKLIFSALKSGSSVDESHRFKLFDERSMFNLPHLNLCYLLFLAFSAWYTIYKQEELHKMQRTVCWSAKIDKNGNKLRSRTLYFFLCSFFSGISISLTQNRLCRYGTKLSRALKFMQSTKSCAHRWVGTQFGIKPPTKLRVNTKLLVARAPFEMETPKQLARSSYTAYIVKELCEHECTLDTP